jgi:hypothetical protein
VEGAASEDGRTPSIWDTFAYDGSVSSSISFSYHLFNRLSYTRYVNYIWYVYLDNCIVLYFYGIGTIALLIWQLTLWPLDTYLGGTICGWAPTACFLPYMGLGFFYWHVICFTILIFNYIFIDKMTNLLFLIVFLFRLRLDWWNVMESSGVE